MDSVQCFKSLCWGYTTGKQLIPNVGVRFHVRCAAASKASKTSAARVPGQGFGTKSPSRTVLDAGILLRRSEQLYDQLLGEFSSERKIREFVVCVREKASSQNKRLDDWLPVAELGLVSELDAEEVVPNAIRLLCREVAECGAKSSASLRQIPRSNLEYAYEPANDFYEFVLGSCFKSKKSDQESERTTEDECPYAVLGLERNATASQVRMAYRTLAAKHHPDKNPGITDDVKFKKIVDAYERIRVTGFTVSQDGYAAIGGNKRQGFSLPVTIDNNTNNNLKELLRDIQVAVRQIDPEIVSLFSARSKRSSSQKERDAVNA